MLKEKRKTQLFEYPLKDMLSLRQRSPGGAVSRIRPNCFFLFVVRADVQLWEDALHYSFLL